MNISNKAQDFISSINRDDFAKYISPRFFDDSFMEREENSEAKVVLVYSALTIAKKIGESGLYKTSFREAESFLRDDPRQSAWEGVLDLKKWFETILLEIQRDYFESSLMDNKVKILTWDELGLEERLDRMAHIVENCNAALERFELGRVELFSVEENEICLNDLTQYVGLRPPAAEKLKELVFDGLAKYINFSFQSRRIKLVAQ